MKNTLLCAICILGGCSAMAGRGTEPGDGTSMGPTPMPTVTPTPHPTPTPTQPPYCGQDHNADADHDGYTPAQGDCNDCEPLVNPGAIEDPTNMVDDNCDGHIDEPVGACDDATLTNHDDAASLAAAAGLCPGPTLLATTLAGPSDQRARHVVDHFGILTPKAGSNMMLLSSGRAVDGMDASVPNYSPQSGTDLGNTWDNPLPGLMGVSGCGQSQPSQVNDYTELVIKLRAPTNAQSFSFDFHFFSAEYPEYVCSLFNDEFLVTMESEHEYATPTNISFDMAMNPITINNGFFSICKNDTKPQTQHCTAPVSDIAGTGYEKLLGNKPMGGSTGWLTTTAPVTPGEELTLHFIIFDEGDGILDSAALIDNFTWSVKAVSGPMTIP